jgi:hypothetical protein
MKWFLTIMGLIMSLVGLYFILSGLIFHISEFYGYLFISLIFLIFATIFIAAEEIIGIREKVEENNRGLWSMDRKMDAILDELKKVKKNVNLRNKK